MCKHGFVKHKSLWNCHPQLLIVQGSLMSSAGFSYSYNETHNLQYSQPAKIFYFNSVILVGLCHGLKDLYCPSKAERKKKFQVFFCYCGGGEYPGSTRGQTTF